MSAKVRSRAQILFLAGSFIASGGVRSRPPTKMQWLWKITEKDKSQRLFQQKLRIRIVLSINMDNVLKNFSRLQFDVDHVQLYL